MIEFGSTKEASVAQVRSGAVPGGLSPENLQELFKSAQSAERLKFVLDVLSTALGHSRFSVAASALVTDLATRLGCDRVSYGVVQGRRVTVRSLSHSAHFAAKATLLGHIEGAMEEALDQRAVIVLPPIPGEPPRVSVAHEALGTQFGAGAICTLPLLDGGKVTGLLTLERRVDQPFDRGAVDVCEAVASFVGPILEVKRRDDRWLLRKAGDSITEALGHLIGPRHVGWKLGVAAFVGLAVFLCVTMGDHRVSAKVVLEGAVQQAAVAPYQAFLSTAPARAGDVVQKGQILATLQDHDLKLERLKWLAQREQYQKERRQALAERDAAKSEILTAQLAQAEAQASLATDKLSRAQITAPFTGVVVTGDWSQQIGSPLEEGKLLFEIAPLDDYRIVLQVNERDIAYVHEQQEGTLVLTSLPDESYPFRVTKIMPVSTVMDGQNVFRVEAQLKQLPSEQLRPAMEGVGKIDIERRMFIWIWTHEVVDWIKLKLWAWLP